MFTNEELNNIALLIDRVNITGKEATAVALLQQKIAGLKNPVETKKEEKK